MCQYLPFWYKIDTIPCVSVYISSFCFVDGKIHTNIQNLFKTSVHCRKIGNVTFVVQRKQLQFNKYIYKYMYV